MILALALAPSLDVTYEVEELRRGDISRTTAITRVAGGKSLNVVRVAAALGAPVRVVAALGGHGGAWVQDLLRHEGIDTTTVPIRRNTRTCIAVVEAQGASSSTDVYEAPTPVDASEWQAFADAALSASAGTTPPRVVLSGSLPAGAHPSQVADLLARLRRAGSWVAVDSSGDGLRALAPHADLLKVNRAEAVELLGGERSAESAAAEMAGRYEAEVVVTDGMRGAAGVLGGRLVRVPRPTRQGRFSAGSGDAFLGGLVAALEQGASAQDALGLGSEAAERNALIAGQGILAPRH